MSTINSLEYDDIRSSIINFLKQDAYYKDFNFEASNISRIINMLTYSTMYNGYYMKMLLDESMPDSARTKTALISHANCKNYLTKFISASKAIVNVDIDAAGVNLSDVPYVQIKKGQTFKGVNKDGKSIFYTLPYDVTLTYDATKNKFIGEDFIIVQGQERTFNYTVTALNQKYQISDPNCDDTSIVVKVKTNKESNISVEYIRTDDFYSIQPGDYAYYITASSSGVYQIHFGRDIFGREPKLGEYIEISYIKTDGSTSNDTNKFEAVVSKKVETLPTDINFYLNTKITTNTIEKSSGGLDSDNIDDLKFSILNHSRLRGRAITDEDIKTVILTEFRDVESINVWSGGDSSIRRYGKTYISIKPKTSELLTNAAKRTISDILVNRYGVISRSDLLFVDPDFTDIILNIKFRVNRELTSDNSSVVKARIEDSVNQYNKEVLSKFDINLSDSNMLGYIKERDNGILTLFSDKILSKSVFLNFNNGKFTVKFGNQLRSITSEIFKYGNLQCKLISDEKFNITIVDVNNGNKFVASIGNLDSLNGVVNVTFPEFIMEEYINILATPLYPDINTFEDNIIRIKTIKVEEI